MVQIITRPKYGLYTPTLTNTTNVDGSTSAECGWTRIGNIGDVFGVISVDPTTTSAATVLKISLPFASDLTAITDLAGVGYHISVPVRITADVTNNVAQLDWLAAFNTNAILAFSFKYKIK